MIDDTPIQPRIYEVVICAMFLCLLPRSIIFGPMVALPLMVPSCHPTSLILNCHSIRDSGNADTNDKKAAHLRLNSKSSTSFLSSDKANCPLSIIKGAMIIETLGSRQKKPLSNRDPCGAWILGRWPISCTPSLSGFYSLGVDIIRRQDRISRAACTTRNTSRSAARYPTF
ncbi:hypothetical protein F4680DRAFT_440860 [Xylaria scruposa]|nr:hypothetical protein F4680DRAFT_440860 [Xylaria scruposa]